MILNVKLNKISFEPFFVFLNFLEKYENIEDNFKEIGNILSKNLKPNKTSFDQIFCILELFRKY